MGLCLVGELSATYHIFPAFFKLVPSSELHASSSGTTLF